MPFATSVPSALRSSPSAKISERPARCAAFAHNGVGRSGKEIGFELHGGRADAAHVERACGAAERDVEQAHQHATMDPVPAVEMFGTRRKPQSHRAVRPFERLETEMLYERDVDIEIGVRHVCTADVTPDAISRRA